MTDNDRVNMQRLLIVMKKARTIVLTLVGTENRTARNFLKHIEAMEKEIKSKL
jgi:hypothetical protein